MLIYHLLNDGYKYQALVFLNLSLVLVMKIFFCCMNNNPSCIITFSKFSLVEDEFEAKAIIFMRAIFLFENFIKH